MLAVSWGLLLAYDLYYFGHPLGLPQSGLGITKAGLALSLGLVFDRQQGFVVQVPATVLGLVGMWRARRSHPLAALSSALTVVFLLFLNGSYTGVPYGGGALAGRFEWTVVPLVLLRVPLVA